MPTLVFGFVMVGAGAYWFINNLIEEELTKSMLASTGKSAENIDRWLKTLILEPETIAATPAAKAINHDFRLIDAQNIHRHKMLHAKYPDIFQDIYAANRHGEYHTVRQNGSVYSLFVGNISNRDYFRSVLSGGPAQITPPLVSRTTGIPTIFIVAPIRDEQDQPQGLIGAGISLQYAGVVAESLKAGKTGYGFIIARDGTFIHHPNKDFVMKRKITELDEPSVRGLGEAMLSGASGMYRYSYAGVEKIAFYQPIPITGWSVATTLPVRELFAPATRMIGSLLIITFLVLTVVGMTIVVATRRLTRPVLDLASHAREIAAGNFPVQACEVTSGDEVGDLARAFNLMTRQLKNTMEGLRSREEEYRTLVNNLSIGVYRHSPGMEGRFLQANPAMLTIFGYADMEDFLGLQVCDLYQQSAEQVQFVDALERNGSVKDVELALQKKDGTPIRCLVIATAQYDERGTVKWIDGVIEDITERKKLEEQLRQSQKMEAIGTLAGGVAHDFNNILTAITGYANLAKHQAESGTKLSGYIDNILTASESASNLTHSLLAFSRKQVMSLKPVDINGIVMRVEKLLQRVIGEDIEFRTILGGESMPVMADGGQMEQVLLNLATNARDAMPDGGILSITTERMNIGDEVVGLSLHQGPYVIISVSDMGSGMSSAIKQRIFEPFYTTKDPGKGTGLGLAIVYGIIKQHGGEITVYSEPGRGTTFRIYLRCVDAQTEGTAVVNTNISSGGTETILVAEDDPIVRELFRNILEEAGYTVIVALDGQDAITKFIENRLEIQLLIFDVVMPKKNGKEAYEEIRKMNEEVRIIFTSGYTRDIIHKKNLFEEGIIFISKPLSPNVLLAKVRKILDA